MPYKNKILFCITALALVVSIVLLADHPAFSYRKEIDRAGVQTITCTVKSIDFVERTITVSYVDPDKRKQISVTFQVSGEAVFTRDTEGIQFSDVQVEDTVEVGYMGDLMHKPILRFLNDLNMANE